MGVQDLQRYIELQAPAACVPADLLRLAHGVALSPPRAPGSRLRPPQLCLVLDAETCLDRLYGGYYSDWACGGQWNRMLLFLTNLVRTVQNNNMELAVFFSGALELRRLPEWVAAQLVQRRLISQALRHAAVKATPPPKVWWTPPACLRSALRLALRQLKVQVLCSADDHRQEVLAFCRENNYHGLLAEHAEYIVFQPPRLFSAKQLKLTYKGALGTQELLLQEAARGLDLQPGRFSLLAALLGNFLLSERDLADFHRALLKRTQAKAGGELRLVAAVVEFVRSLPSVDCLDSVAERVFGSISDRRAARLKESVAYYVDGARNTYFRDRPPAGGRSEGSCPARLASERDSEPGDGPPSEPGSVAGSGATDCLAQKLGLLGLNNGYVPGTAPGSYRGPPPASDADLPDLGADGPLVTLEPPPLPPVTTEVLSTAAERHQKGLMTPWVHQVLTKGELKLAVSLEDELSRELPAGALFYRPVRERIYGVLFNLYHHTFLNHRDREKPETERHPLPIVQVREWAYSRGNPYRRPELVTAKPLGWGVPTVQRLWFGSSDDDKKRRLRAFLTCLQADTAGMRSAASVPQHLLILACVLRYMMSQVSANEQSFIFKPELDAFIAQALCPKLTDTNYQQELQLAAVTPRGVQLASLFMQGVETALFANDACGAPVPLPMCCPWLFFDGKLFHSYLLKAAQSRNVTQLCDGRAEMVAQLEMTRQAVLEGLPVQYGRPPLAAASPQLLPERRGGRLEVAGVVVGSWAGGGPGRGAGLLPAGMHHHRQHHGRAPAAAGKPGKKPQGRRKADSGDRLLPAGRAMTVDTDTREVGGAAADGSSAGAAGQFQDAPLLQAQ